MNEINHFGPITAIDKNRSHCWMNAIAKQTYGFTEKETSAESRVLLIKEMLANKKLLAEVYAEFEALLLSKGVISMKEIVFDDAEFLSNIPQRKILSNLYVQAVQEPLQHELLYEYKEKVFPEKV
ncbi:hydrolase, partial [Enterococcus faecium]